jgi:hypothetical protein
LRTADTLGPVPDAPAESAAAVAGGRARLLAAIRRRLTLERLAAVVLGLLVLLVHDVPYLLSHSFWLDESWVAATTRFPVSQLPETTSSTPIGWSALLRLVTVPRTQSPRLLPLAFAAAAVVVGYWFARQLGWRHREEAVCAGLLGGIAVLLVPGMLVQGGLNQYTADACLSLLALALTSRLEREWSRRRLAALSVAVWGGMLFSDGVAFLGMAAFVALCAVQLVRRDWRRFAEACAASAVTAVLMLAVYKAFDARAVGPGLYTTGNMRLYFMPLHNGVHAMVTFITSHFAATHAEFGLGPVWLAVPLVIAGIVTIFRLGRPATALAVAVLWPVMIVVNAARRYPFLNIRTSTFLFAVTAVVAAVGLIGVCSLLRPFLKQWAAAGLVAVAAVGAVVFAVHAQPFVRVHLLPNEDERQQTSYVAAHAAGHDVILVDTTTAYGFAYYWPVGQPARRTDHYVAQQYVPYFPDQPRIVVALNGKQAGVAAAVSQAVRQSVLRSCARIWLIRTHESPAEQLVWAAALQQKGLAAVPVGSDGLSVVLVRKSLCR